MLSPCRLVGHPWAARHLPGIVIAVLFLGGSGAAHAQLVITPTFDSTITGDPQAATIEAGINAAISRVEAAIANPITVKITFGEMGSGLGASSTAIFTGVSYSSYLSALQTRQTPSANDTT